MNVRIIVPWYYRLYKYPNDLFGFQKGHSTDHAIVQLVDQMQEFFLLQPIYFPDFFGSV